MKDATVSARVELDVKNEAEPNTLDTMSDAELNAKLTHSYEQSLHGEGRPFTEVFDELERRSLR